MDLLAPTRDPQERTERALRNLEALLPMSSVVVNGAEGIRRLMSTHLEQVQRLLRKLT